jgi:translation initiation factor IF-1
VVKVKLENEAVVLAHAAGAAKTNFVRVRPGDRVEVELSPHDPGRGRITKLLENK